MSLITVIMPVYNGEKYLAESIDSILNQSFADFKLLVLNDNSNDSTLDILNNYLKKDKRVEVIHKTTNHGPAHLRNEGIKLATTKYVALQDADDIALPTRFEKQINVLEQNPEIGLCGTWFTIFGDKKEKIIKHSINHDALKVQFLTSCGIGNSTVMLKKDILGYLVFEDQFVPAEDYGLWSQLIGITQFYNIPESLLRYRWHPNNISQTKAKNLKKAEVLIKKRQLTHLGISEKDPHIDFYLNSVSLRRKLNTTIIKSTIEASKALKSKNLKTKYYNQDLFEAHINRTIIRTIRNSSHPDLAFLRYLKKDSGYFKYIPALDKLVLFLRCLF
ncbi:glycosyltransferase family 2 protein [Tamlana sp. 2201CG12-4]|uniref:glycosyltransferase family 2 protein n=1 Tax=Tamlana sp. 2201CG12-4 TaxID=3112582 RepID=UPI002DBCEB88|nr:glycosyltransferase family 2 protein [Tamlana sp. 2201CG12-4]MEC3907604.1 glycosyltransferase family 2 protein [Tamlana sp. 2201CG12-4]